MAARGPRPGDADDSASRGPVPGRDEYLVRIHDLAGRPRGVGFVADHHGTLVTSHETVDGLSRLALHAAGDRSRVVNADEVTSLPELGLALVRAEGLGVDPLPVSARDRLDVGTYVRIPAGCWREARVLGATSVTYTATDRFHLLDDVLELAIGTAGRDALRLGGGAAGGPVLDATTGAVVGVLGTALHNGHRDAGFAVPLRPTSPGPLTDLLTRNTTTVPAYGADLNMAGVLRLTAASVGQDGPAAAWAEAERRGAGGAATGEPSEGGENASRVGPGMASGGALERGGADGGWSGAAEAGGHRAAAGVPAAEWASGGDPREDGRRDEPAGAGSSAGWPGDGGPGTRGSGAGIARTGRAGSGDSGRAGSGGGPAGVTVPVERRALVAEFAAFLRGPAHVLGLVGEPGSGRTTELAALAARRYRCAEPAPVLWLRGADLEGEDASVVDAARRALTRAARIVAATLNALPTDLGDLTPDRLARISHAAGRPLLLLLDSPEEMPSALARRLPEWTAKTATWLRETGARLVVACREEFWEDMGAGFPDEMLHRGTSPLGVGPEAAVPGAGRGSGGGGETPDRLPPRVHLGDLDDDEARQARARYRVPDHALAPADARHPLTLRLLAEIQAALPDTAALDGPLDRTDVFSAYLDLVCLRIAARLAAAHGLRGTAVRRFAAKVSGQVHEAARRSLGPGQGELDRTSFEAVFPWGPAPARLGGGTGWAQAVLAEGLLVPAGTGYRFAHEELADWLQGTHLDLDEALRALVHRRHTGPRRALPLPVPHHRVGPVVQAVLLLARQHGTARLALTLEELVYALDADPHSWWAARILTAVLRRVPDATPYTAVLHLLTDRVVTWRHQQQPLPADLGPGFWTALRLPQDARLDLLRRLVLADGPPHETGARFLDAVARLLTADPTAVQPHLVRWFDDERPLPATPDATVAKAAQALLHTHRHRALDELTEVLVTGAHPLADELLAVLAEDEPSAICRAVDRWAHDERPARRVAAVAYALRAAPHVRTEADRELLRYAALILLARPGERPLHGGALALLVRDPHTRARHLPQALGHFVAGDPQFPPSALVPALATHPDPVLDAFRARLRRPDAGEALRTLADVTTPALARRVAALVRETVERRPDMSKDVAGYVDRRLDQGPGARTVLLPLVTGLLDGGPERVRAALAGVLAAPGTPASRPLREELLEVLLGHEDDPSVLIAVLHAAASRDDDPLLARGLVHRAGLLLVRTPEGATRFDRDLVDLGRQVSGFAARVADWLSGNPEEWAAVVGPSARRTIENLAGARVPA